MSARHPVVTLLVMIAVALGGCGVGAEPTPTRLDDLALPPEPVPEEAAPDEVEGPSTPVFFVRGERLEPVERPVPATVAGAVRALLEGPRETEADSGLRSAIPAGTVLRGTTVDRDVVTVDLSDGFSSVVGPEQVLALAQLVYTATSVPGVSGVRLSIGGEPVDAGRGDGSLAPGPVGRADYPDVSDA